MSEIPTATRRPIFTEHLIAVKDLELAAACLADDRVPRLRPDSIEQYIENETHPFYQFKIFPSPRAQKIVAVWKQCQKGATDSPKDPAAIIFRAFRYWSWFVDIIQSRYCQVKPEQTGDCIWTENTKVASASLAVWSDNVLPKERLLKMIFRANGRYGFLIRDRKAIEAFASPAQFIATNPDDPVSYVVAAFSARDMLRDMVKGIQARYIFRNEETNEVFFVADPEKPLPKTGDSLR